MAYSENINKTRNTRQNNPIEEFREPDITLWGFNHESILFYPGYRLLLNILQ